jgi:uncharacterized protein (TIGR04222 family)
VTIPNPFDLSGPEFLVFYALLAVVVLGAAQLLGRGSAASAEVPHISTDDPHLVAYLRGGPNEALRIGVASLVDRNLLRLDKKAKRGFEIVARRGSDAVARRPVEKAILRHFAKAAAPESVFKDRDVVDKTEDYGTELEQRGLLLDGPGRAARRQRFLIAGGVLLAVAGLRLILALERGRTNVGFLIVEGILVVLLGLWLLGWSTRTALGDRALADLRELFRGLRDRAGTLRPGGATNEVALVAAVFGLAALPSDPYADLRGAYARSTRKTSGGWAASCGSIGGGGSSCGG